MPAGLPESSFVAKLPRVATSFGSMSSIWRKRCGSQDAISSGSGSRFPARPALEDVRDEDVRARQADAAEELVEELPGLTHERDALLVLVESRCLADEHELRARAPGAEDDLRTPLRKGAAGAARGLLGVRSKCGGALDGVHRTVSLRRCPDATVR